MRVYILIILILNTVFSFGQTGPAGVGTNDGSSSLKLWLDAERGVYADTNQNRTAVLGDRVSFWKDLSGSRNDVFALSDSTRPTFVSNSVLNGASAVRFTKNAGSKNKRNFLSSKAFSKTNDITIYCVFYAVTKADGNDITPAKTNTFSLNLWYYGAGLVDCGVTTSVNDISLGFCDTSLAVGAGDSTTGIDYCVKTPASLSKTYFATLEKQAWNGKLRIAQNGGVPAEYQAGTQPINSPTRYYIGSNSNLIAMNDSPFFDGFISTVLVYNKILSAAEKIILENYLAAKYGIQMKSNDLYTFDELPAGNYDSELIGIGKAADGTYLKNSKGEGMIELSATGDLEKGIFNFMAHNGKSLNAMVNDLPLGVQLRVEREWVFANTGTTNQPVDLIVDPALIPGTTKDDIVLLVDSDNNGRLSNEVLGEGLIPVTEVTGQGRLAFRGVKLKNGDKITFGKLEQVCLSGCETYFTPNGDGVADVYFLEHPGKTSIYDRAGRIIKNIPTPSYWDGTNEKGDLVAPGLYFLISNEDIQKTVTLIR